MILRPSMLFFYLDSVGLCVGLLTSFIGAIMTIIYRPTPTLAILIFIASLHLCMQIRLVYKYYLLLFRTSWEITDEQIIITNGVFSKTTNYIELYRVIDYSENQRFIDQIFGVFTLIIESGDKNTPKLKIFGIKYNKHILKDMRDSVERAKARRRILEITN